jgi:AcrR family transcriptional regulator
MVTPDRRTAHGHTAKGLATRERILQSAASVLLAEGLSGFNLDKVREAASVSGSQLTHYFPDKADLVRSTVMRQTEVVLGFHREPKVGGLDTFDDWERWLELNLRYLRKIGYSGTATYHTLAGQLAKSDDVTRRIFADGYMRWVNLLEDSFARMKSRGVLLKSADPRHLALVVVGCHQGAGILSFTYRQEWPLAYTSRFIVNYLRLFAADPAQRVARRPRPTQGGSEFVRHTRASDEDSLQRFTRKGLATRAGIVEGAAELIYERGVNGTSLDDVRRTVGVSGSQMSHYFGDKQDLVRQVIAARADFVVGFHLHPRMGHLDSIRDLETWADLCWTQAGAGYLRYGCVYGSLTGELLEAEDVILDELAVGYDRWLEVFCDGLSAMREHGDLVREANPRQLAVALVAAHQGGTLLTHITASAEPFHAAVDAAIDYVASFGTTEPNRATSTRRAKSIAKLSS